MLVITLDLNVTYSVLRSLILVLRSALVCFSLLSASYQYNLTRLVSYVYSVYNL